MAFVAPTLEAAENAESGLPADGPTSANRATGGGADAPEWSTEDSPLKIQLRDGTCITLGANSRVTRQGLVPISVGLPGAAPRAIALDLARGTLSVEVNGDRRSFHTVLVRAPRKVGALVRSGRATLQVTPTATTVSARSGLDMTVAVAESWRMLRVGRAFTVSSATPAGAQKQLLSAPRLAVDRSVVLALGARQPGHHLSWSTVAGAGSYHLRLFRVDNAMSTPVRESHHEIAEAELTGLEPGRYFANVSTIDPDGIESDPSAPIHLRVLAARLPEGAYLSPTAVHLPERARLTLLHTEGLEMTYGSGDSIFLPVPETLGLHDGQGVRIRLREKGSSLDTPLYLEPLDVKPRIAFDPTSAIWPGAPIGVSISLRTSDGSNYPNESSIGVEVTVNAQPTSAKWQREPGVMSTRIEKPPCPGPWVLRVVVHDSSGHVLARDFLEIAEQHRDLPRTNAIAEARY